MPEMIIPTWIMPSDDGEEREWVDTTTQVFEPSLGPGPGQRQSYGGARLRLKRRHTAVRMEERTVLESMLLGGDGRTFTIRTKPHVTLRGSFPCPDIFLNPTFASGTANWSSYTDYTVAVNDRIYRAVSNGNSNNSPTGNAGGGSYPLFQFPTYTLNAPYAMRAVVKYFGFGTQNLRVYGNPDITSVSAGVDFPAGGGYAITGFNTAVAGNSIGLVSTVTAPAGSGLDVYWVSAARCAMVEVAGNLLLQSSDFSNAQWTKVRSTIAANASVDPRGLAEADSIIEDSSNNTHYVIQTVGSLSAGVEDYCFAVALQANTRTFARISMEEAAFHQCYVDINLTTGALGTPTVTGANWANPRAFAARLGGNGWWYVCIIGQKVSASTTVNSIIFPASALGTISYTGDSASNIRAWRATFKRSSWAIALTGTSTAQITGNTTGGAQLLVKGLPVSAGDLLLPGDWVEINGELKMVTASLNADAAGGGVLAFRPALVRLVPDNTPVVIKDPMGKFILAGPHRASNRFASQSDIEYELEHVYE